MNEERMKVVMVEPNKPAYITEIGSDLASMQEAVGGLIEPIYFLGDAIMVGNEEAKLIGLDGNRANTMFAVLPQRDGTDAVPTKATLGSGNNIVAGPFFICSEKMTDNGTVFCSLSDELCEKYVQHFAQPQEISQDEVQRDMGFTLIMM